MRFIEEILPPRSGGVTAPEAWAFNPIAAAMIPDIAGAENATVADVGAGRYTFTPAATLTEPLLSAGVFTAQVTTPNTVSGSGIQYLDFVIPVIDPADTVAFINTGLKMAADSFGDTFLKLSGGGGAGDYIYFIQVTLGSPNSQVQLIYVEAGIDGFIDLQLSLVAGDRLYFGYDPSTGEIYSKVNDGAAVLVRTVPLAGRAIPNELGFSMMSTVASTVFTAGSIDFTFSSTLNGVTGFQTVTPPELPVGVKDGSRYVIGGAGGTLFNKPLRVGDVVEFINDTSDLIITRVTDEAALASAASLAAVQQTVSILPTDGVLKDSLLEIGVYLNNVPVENNIPSMDSGLNFLRPDVSGGVVEQWAIDMGIVGGELLKFTAGADRPTIITCADGQKIRMVTGPTYNVPGSGAVISYTGIIENFSERPEEKAEILAYIGGEFGTSTMLYNLIWMTDWCIPMAVAKSMIEPYRRSIGVYDTVNSARGGIAYPVRDGASVHFFEKNLVRKLDSKLSLAAFSISNNLPISFHRDGGFAIWPAGTNFRTWSVGGITSQLSVAGVGGSFKFLKYDKSGEYSYQASGGNNRLVRRPVFYGNLDGFASLYTDSINDPALGWGAFTPDGAYLVVGGNADSFTGAAPDRALRVIDLSTFTEHLEIVNPGWGAGANLSAGNLFDVGQVGVNYFIVNRSNADNIVHLYNFTTQSIAATRNRADALVIKAIAALDPRSTAATMPVLATAYVNDPTNTVVTLEIFNFNGGTVLGEISFTPSVMFTDEHVCMSVSPDGMYLFCLGSIIDISDYSDPKVVTAIPAINGVYSWCHQ